MCVVINKSSLRWFTGFRNSRDQQTSFSRRDPFVFWKLCVLILSELCVWRWLRERERAVREWTLSVFISVIRWEALGSSRLGSEDDTSSIKLKFCVKQSYENTLVLSQHNFRTLTHSRWCTLLHFQSVWHVVVRWGQISALFIPVAVGSHLFHRCV